MDNNTTSTNKPPLTKKELRMQRREEKVSERTKQESVKKKNNAMYFAIAIVLILGAAYTYWNVSRTATSVDLAKDRSTEFAIQGQEHIKDGESHPAYNSDPPTSGWHYVDPAKEGVYDTALPDERMVHNLEHGNIWISYHPRVSQEVVEQLKQLATSVVIMTPREANSTDIALAAWGRLDTFNLDEKPLDEGRIKGFISRYRNKGPEKIPMLPGLR